MTKQMTVHPFPARMAPEVVHETIDRIDRDAVVLDPMCGSGTVLRYAAERGVRSLGFDLDPLAIKIARCWGSPPELHAFIHDARQALAKARLLRDQGIEAPSWHDESTDRYARFWFGEKQRRDLAALGTAIMDAPRSTSDALGTALSRLIITKEHGASLARDVSHSRPHRVMTDNVFDVFPAFEKSVDVLIKRLGTYRLRAPASISEGDARILSDVPDGSIDCTITSPPYLNAIDYMRGHRLSLIWMGWRVGELSTLRSSSVGAERGGDSNGVEIGRYLNVIADASPNARVHGWLARYVADAERVVLSLSRVSKPTGARIIMIVGNSVLRGAEIDNSAVYVGLLRDVGFDVSARSRSIPQGSRYLPMGAAGSSLSQRMREEVVIRAER